MVPFTPEMFDSGLIIVVYFCCPQGLDQERVIKRLMTLPPGVTIVDD